MSIRKVIEWTAIFGTLSAFTLWVGAAYAQSGNAFLSANLSKHQSHLVVYFNGQVGRLAREQFLCDITPAQLKALQAHYNVSLSKQGGYTVATVTPDSHSDTKVLKQIVGEPEAAHCQQHVKSSVFYLFTVPSLS